MDKKVLYLSEDYSTSKVHHNLCQSLAETGVGVTLFAILRGNYQPNIRSTYGKVDYEWHIDQLSCNRLLYRVLFAYKKHYKYRKLATEVNLNNIGMCHAATLFSDGAIALKLKEERNIPYVVSVRATDVDIYSKWMCHLWSMGRKIIKAAERVIFISPTIQDALLKSKPFSGMHEEIRNKSVIIPNGIDEVWLENIRSERPKININAPRIIYVGVLDKNKNVLRLMDAVDSLSKKYPGIKLSIVGGNGSTEDIIRKRCIDNPNRYQMLGKIYDKDKLQRLMCQHDIFAMVSLCETFGLVYVEAMSQGLPILYSQGRGIDGIFEEKVGEAVKPDEKISIVEGLERMILHYDEYAVMGDKLQRFSWPMLAKEYVKIYKDFI